MPKTLPWTRSFASHVRSAQWSSQNSEQPCDLALNKNAKFWFRCERCPHEFQASLSKIVSGTWCPYCTGRKRCKADLIKDCRSCWKRCFGSHDKAQFWSVRNHPLKPWDVAKNDNDKYWFQCDVCCHDFQASPAKINRKATKGHGGAGWCPFCANRQRCTRTTITNCRTCWDKTFALHPKAAHWSLRNKVHPEEIALNTQTKYWFQCDVCHHEFDTSPAKVNGRDSWCPYCTPSHRRRCGDEFIKNCTWCWAKSFASHPSSLNWSRKNSMASTAIALNDNNDFLFECVVCAHEYTSRPNDCVQNETTGCPFCINRQRCPSSIIQNCAICLDKTFASHPRAKDWSSNNKSQPHEHALHDHNAFLFQCDSCHHEFDAPLTSIASGRWCPFCANRRRCDDIHNCLFCWAHSFAGHEKAEHWSTTNTIKAYEVARTSNQKVWFNCKACKHEFVSTPLDVSQGGWCPFCVNRRRCQNVRDCTFCWNNCFASHVKSKYWATRNVTQPSDHALREGRRLWFRCDSCQHEFQITLYAVARGNWCGFCANQRRCKNVLDCAFCLANTFAAHPKAVQWSSRNSAQPHELAKCDARKVWFQCDKCPHEFQSSTHKVSQGHWCPFCRFKTETLVYEWCVTFDMSATRGTKFDWCINAMTNRQLPFDIYCPSIRTIVEVDGAHHFRNVMNWGDNLTDRQERDVYKMQCALSEGLRIVRLAQEDVWKSPHQWRLKLQKALESTEESILMIAQDDALYDEHRRILKDATVDNRITTLNEQASYPPPSPCILTMC